jgi:hypothetical protein
MRDEPAGHILVHGAHPGIRERSRDQQAQGRPDRCQTQVAGKQQDGREHQAASDVCPHLRSPAGRAALRSESAFRANHRIIGRTLIMTTQTPHRVRDPRADAPDHNERSPAERAKGTPVAVATGTVVGRFAGRDPHTWSPGFPVVNPRDGDPRCTGSCPPPWDAGR